jgi:hypothetical protein
VFVFRGQMFYCEVGTEILDIISMNCKLQYFNFLKDDIQETYSVYGFCTETSDGHRGSLQAVKWPERQLDHPFLYLVTSLRFSGAVTSLPSYALINFPIS